jgi:CheY-like chemotaxis protein
MARAAVRPVAVSMSVCDIRRRSSRRFNNPLAANRVPPPLPPPKPPPGKLPLPSAPPNKRAQGPLPPPPPPSKPLPIAGPPSRAGSAPSGSPQARPAEPAAPSVPAAAAQTKPSAEPAPAAGARVIIVAEDDMATRNMVSRALRPQYHVYEVVDGQHALDLLERIKPPDLMILDIMMPHVNGLSVAARCKADPRLKSVPIIFLTGLDAPKDIIEGIKAGARHYVTKPFNMADLLAKIVKTIGAGK